MAHLIRSAASNPNGTRITRIMYDSFLSYTMISRDLKDPVNAGLIVNGSDIRRHIITDKGLKFLELAEKNE